MYISEKDNVPNFYMQKFCGVTPVVELNYKLLYAVGIKQMKTQSKWPNWMIRAQMESEVIIDPWSNLCVRFHGHGCVRLRSGM